MWELDHKEGWVLKNWCFWTVVLKTLESHLDCKKIQPVHPKGNQSWILIEGADPEAEAPMLWPPDAKSQLIGQDPDAGQDWRWKKGMTGWDGWMALLTQWTWSWASSKRWWRTGKPGVLQSLELQELDTTEWLNNKNGTVESTQDGGLVISVIILILLPTSYKLLNIRLLTPWSSFLICKWKGLARKWNQSHLHFS